MLIVVDALGSDMLERAVAAGSAPTFAKLLERGTYIPDCVSSFPSVTPVACSEIATGVGADRHWISGMNWFHRVERRYVEYGSSFEATRTFGLFRTLYDTVYNMNMGHLSHEVETFFERLGDNGVRTAVTPFLIYRGRHRHELGLEGVMRRVAVAADFRHAVWGPDELFYGELYASRKVPCRPTMARPGTRDEYSACVSVEMVNEDLYDFLLFSLPDNDYYSHKFGPDETETSIAHADTSLQRVVDAAGGMDSFLEQHAVIAMADHCQSAVDERLDLQTALDEEWRVLQPNSDQPEHAELAVSPTSRAAHVYVLSEGARQRRTHQQVREKLGKLDGVDLVAWLCTQDGAPPERLGVGAPIGDGIEAVVSSAAGELRFRPGSGLADRRDGRWDVEGDFAVLEARSAGGRFESDAYPDALSRLWSALTAPHAGDVLVSLALGYECVDWGNADHVPGGSHGSLRAEDSLAPLLFVGVEPPEREQWTLRDVREVVLSHFGVPAQAPVGAAA